MLLQQMVPDLAENEKFYNFLSGNSPMYWLFVTGLVSSVFMICMIIMVLNAIRFRQRVDMVMTEERDVIKATMNCRKLEKRPFWPFPYKKKCSLVLSSKNMVYISEFPEKVKRIRLDDIKAVRMTGSFRRWKSALPAIRIIQKSKGRDTEAVFLLDDPASWKKLIKKLVKTAREKPDRYL